jgi:hypothetical protein
MLEPDINKIATDLIARYSTAFVDRLSAISRSHMHSVAAFLGVGLTGLIAEQLRQIKYVKTFLSLDELAPFSDLYVNLTLSSSSQELEDNDLVSQLQSARRFIVLGTAGSGKSMLMRYIVLMLSEKSHMVPILVELRRYNSYGDKSFLDLIYDITHAGASVSLDLFVTLLKRGGFVFLFDGFDEVEFSRRGALETEIEEFVGRFGANSYVLTSRPADDVPWWPGFLLASIRPLSLDQSKALVRKCRFDEKMKASFIEAMNDLAPTHGSFLENPLLVTIMLLLYQDTVRIPAKMNLFYSMAFDVLFYRHDSLKAGRYIRKRYTPLLLDDFRRIFSVFCAFTYSENRYAFLLPEFVEDLKVSIRYSEGKVDADDLRKDLVESVAMLQADGLYYTFVHRTFQEYFTAVFLATDPHIELYSCIGRILERQITDAVLLRLFEISRDKCEKEWAIPYLRERLGIADGAINSGQASSLVKSLFGKLRFFSREGGIGVCAGVEVKFCSDPGLNVIESIYLSPNNLARYYDLRWSDEAVVRSIVETRRKGLASDQRRFPKRRKELAKDIVDAAERVVARADAKEDVLTEEFQVSHEDDGWLSETVLIDFANERVVALKEILRLLEKKAHDRPVFPFHQLR